MGCSACSRRKSTGRIIPVNPSKQKAERTGNTNTTNRGNTLISKLRYTGR